MVQRDTARPAVGRPLGLEDLTLEDVESVRLLLRGRSVIDWHRLDFSDHDEVDRFLRVNEFDPESFDDMTRLEELRMDAVGYLTRTFNFPIPIEVAEEAPTRDLLLMASRSGPHRRWACVVLKVMHIVHHLAGRELTVRLPISDDKVFRAVELKVMQVIEELRSAGHPIQEFEWSRKTRDSLITKLLAKRSTQAARIYDRLRFRLIVPTQRDLVPMLAVLTRQLVPFNYLIPGATVNSLVPFEDTLRSSTLLRQLERDLQPESKDELADRDLRPPMNEFSGSQYKIINFVADLPVRLSAILPPEQLERVPPETGHVVFVMTEFQLADKQTTINNEKGDSSHDAYKARQHGRVRERLLNGTSDDGQEPKPRDGVDDDEEAA